MQKRNNNIIIGRKPVLEALINKARIDQVLILYGTHGNAIDSIFSICKRNKVRCSVVKKERFQSLTDEINTQGVIAIKTSVETKTLDDMFKLIKNKKNSLLVAVDSIQDVHNLGAIIRTSECAGVDAIIKTVHNTAPLNETVAKTSAGAVEHLPIVEVNNLASTLELLKENGFWIFGTSLKGTDSYTTKDYNLPAVIVLGNEEKGLRPLIESKCDFLIKIPMYGKIDSLNVSVSAGVLLFEILRQRNLK